MINRRNIIIIVLILIITLLFIFYVIPQVYLLMIFFQYEDWIILLVLMILIPLYFILTILLLINEIKNRFREKDKINHLKNIPNQKNKKVTNNDSTNLELKINLVYNSVLTILKETESFSVKELAEMLDIDYKEVLYILNNLLSENMLKGIIKNNLFYKT